MRNKILMIIIIILVLFLGIITTYIYKKQQLTNKEGNFYIINFDESNETFINEELDKNKYENNIITEPQLNYDFDIKINNISLKGNIYIDNDEYIYINSNNEKIKLSDIKFKALYVNYYEVENIFNVYAISNDNKLYKISIMNLAIKSIKPELINTINDVVNFTNLNIPNYGLIGNSMFIVLCADGNMYNPYTNIRYDKDLIILDSKYYIYNNKIYNSNNLILKDENNKELKIKKYIEFTDANNIFNSNSIIITDSNKIVYISEDLSKLYIYDKIISKIEYKLISNTQNVIINLIFKDKTTMNFTGMYTEKYGFE